MIRRQGVRAHAAGACAALVLVLALLPLTAAPAASDVTAANATMKGVRPAVSVAVVKDPSLLVDPFAGTGTGGTNPGSIGEFPGADTPFGMLQWSPDTTPDRLQGGGYSSADSHISGFSLTHASGMGCASYGDVPILPTVGAIGDNPADTSDSFSHAHEHATPGRYEVRLGPAGITTQLAVTTRTGLARLTFPKTTAANVLFKAGDSAAGASAATAQVKGNDEVTGQVTSGQFCGTGTNYTLHYVAKFNRAFSTSGTWVDTNVAPGTKHCTGASCGLYVTFSTMKNDDVLMKVGISFVSGADATANLEAEDPGWSLANVEKQATNQWNAVLAKIGVGGGTATQQRIFYTALYHSLLHPNVVSDVNGRYAGEDGRTHQVSAHKAQYANFSEWDIYRSEIQLLSLVAPTQAGDMMQSLVNDAAQDGWLPKWAMVAGDAAQMNGDSVDPIIASAYAFGVRGFDVKAALAAMVKGATENEPSQGLEIERQYLNQYLSQHYVNADSLDLDSIDYSDGASATLEYAIDDFSIAKLAQSLGKQAISTTMMKRAHNWEYLFDPTTGYLEGRNTDGSFQAGPALNPARFEPGGEQGFEEGNAIQYTWSVPQDLAALADLMGGGKAASAELNSFVTQLNAGRYAPYDWAGNEPSLWTPWEFDYFGAPWHTQQTVRAIADTLYHDAPVNEPGNDDLGALSSWYVWAAIGLYPVTPATANLALASPLFPDVDITLPDHKHLVLHAPTASPTTPYIQALRIQDATTARLPVAPVCADATGATTQPVALRGNWTRPWLPSAILQSGGTLTYTLGSRPDTAWGTAAADAPPSFASGRIATVGYTLPSGSLLTTVGSPTVVYIGIARIDSTAAVGWRATASAGIALSSTQGSFPPTGAHTTPTPSGAGCDGSSTTIPLTVTATATGSGTVTITFGPTVPPVVLDVTAS